MDIVQIWRISPNRFREKDAQKEFGPVCVEWEWKRRSNDELYEMY